jgi:hypothetical protein
MKYTINFDIHGWKQSPSIKHTFFVMLESFWNWAIPVMSIAFALTFNQWFAIASLLALFFPIKVVEIEG